MNYELELLEMLASWFKKQPVLNEHYHLVQEETKRVEKVMLQHLMSLTNQTQLETYIQINLYKLVEICDQFYLPDADDHCCAALVLDLLTTLRKTVDPLIPQDLPLPLLLRKIKAEIFKEQWLLIEKELISNGVDSLLVDITGFAFNDFVNAKARPKWSNYRYLRAYLETLERIAYKGDTESLMLILIRLGYNYSRFTGYCYRWIQRGFAGKHPEEKTSHLVTLKKQIRQLELLNIGDFDPRNQGITDELVKWIDEELSSIGNEPTEMLANPKKMNTKLKVLELAYWGKLQYDNGIYDEINLDTLSEKIASNFSSKCQEELSAASIKSKFYPKDRSIIQPIEEILVKMLEDVRQFML